MISKWTTGCPMSLLRSMNGVATETALGPENHRRASLEPRRDRRALWRAWVDQLEVTGAGQGQELSAAGRSERPAVVERDAVVLSPVRDQYGHGQRQAAHRIGVRRWIPARELHPP